MSTLIRPGSGLLIGTLAALLAAGCGGNNNSFDAGGDTGANNEAGGDAASDATSDGTADARADGNGGDATSDGARDGSPDSSRDGGGNDATQDTGSDAGSTDAGPTATIGDTCAGATPITAAGTLSHQGLDGLNADYAVSSDGNNCQHANGVDGVYSIVVPAGERLTVTVTPEALLDPVVNLVASPASNCGVDPLACLAGVDTGSAGDPETVQYVNGGSADQTVYIMVGSYSSSPSDTAFAITTELATPQAGDSCALPTPIATPGTLSAQSLMGFERDLSIDFGSTGCQNYSGVERVYSITVPSGKRLNVTATGDTNLDAVLDLIAGPADNCSAASVTCLAGADNSGSGGTETASYLNTGSSDQTVFIAVGSYYSSGSTSTFDLTTSVETPPEGDSCNSATPIATPGSLAAQSLDGFGHDYDTGGGTGCSYEYGAERVYSIVVPAGKRLTATATPTGMLDPVVTLIDAPAANCSASSLVCRASSNAGGIGEPETVLYVNGSSTDQTVFVLVASYDSAPADTGFTLDTSVDTPPPGDVCGSAIPVTTDGTLNGDLSGFTSDYQRNIGYSNGCTGFSGLDAAYGIAVPAGMQLTATVTGSAGLNAVLNLVSGTAADCSAAPGVCAASADNTGAGESETVRYVNSGTADETVYLLVASYGSAPTSTAYTLTTALAPPPAGDTCVSAQALTTPATLTGEDLAAFSRDYNVDYLNSTCQNWYGNDKVYATVVPAGRTLSVTVTGDAGFDAVVDLVAGPASNCSVDPLVCLAGVDDTGSGSAENVTYANTTAADQTVYILVGSYSSTPSATTYSIATTLQ